jgi:hypothetical protein
MKKTENSSVGIKSNVTLKRKGVENKKPIDNMERQYFDVRLADVLTQQQKQLLEKMHFWAKVICDENMNQVQDPCYKGCENCGAPNNNCQRPQNFLVRRK